MLNKWLSFELYCFALILLQKLQLFCFWHLFMLKMCSKHQFATSVTFWIERALWAGWAWPGCCHGACYCNVRPSLAHFLIVVNEYLPLVCWGCSIFLFYFLCLLCIFLIILHHCLVCTRWYTETFPWSRGLCPPWKLVCKFPLEAQWARWKWALVSLSTGHEELRLAPLPLEWASGSWGVV